MNPDVKNMSYIELCAVGCKTKSPLIKAELKRRKKQERLEKFKLLKSQ